MVRIVVGFVIVCVVLGIQMFECILFRPGGQEGHMQHLIGAFGRLGNGPGAYPWPDFSTFVVHMVVGVFVGFLGFRNS